MTTEPSDKSKIPSHFIDSNFMSIDDLYPPEEAKAEFTQRLFLKTEEN